MIVSTNQSLVHSQERMNEDSSISVRKDPYDFSADGRSGRRTSGGSRGDCPQYNPGLVALMPKSNWGKTISDHPTWWFYVPYSSQEVPVAAFVLQDEEYNDIYRGEIDLPSRPGFMGVTLPKEAPPLIAGKSYRWQLNLHCSIDRSSAPIYVSGWIDRVSSPVSVPSIPDPISIYTSEQLWFETVDHLAQLQLENPNNTTLINQWNQLLETEGVELQQLQNFPIAGKVNFVANWTSVVK